MSKSFVASLIFLAASLPAFAAPQDDLDKLLAQKGLMARLGDTIQQATDRAGDLVSHAMQSLGVLFIGTFPLLRDAVCLSALYSILAFSFSGFTYPIEGMVPAMQSLSYLFPLREYYQAYVNEAIFGAGFTQSYRCMVILLMFQLLPFLILHRLQNALIKQNFSLK